MNIYSSYFQYILDTGNRRKIIEHIFYQNLWKCNKYETFYNNGRLFVNNVKVAEIDFSDDQSDLILTSVEWLIHGKPYRGDAFVYADEGVSISTAYPADILNAQAAGILLVQHFKDVVHRRWEAEAELEKLYALQPVGSKMRESNHQQGLDSVKKSNGLLT